MSRGRAAPAAELWRNIFTQPGHGRSGIAPHTHTSELRRQLRVGTQGCCFGLQLLEARLGRGLVPGEERPESLHRLQRELEVALLQQPAASQKQDLMEANPSIIPVSGQLLSGWFLP